MRKLTIEIKFTLADCQRFLTWSALPESPQGVEPHPRQQAHTQHRGQQQPHWGQGRAELGVMIAY